MITIHVDDIRGSSPNHKTADKLLADIGKLFKITVSNDTDPFLGIQTEIDEQGNVKIHQEAYVYRVLKRFGMLECKPVLTPLTLDLFSKKQCPQTEAEKEKMADTVSFNSGESKLLG